MTSLHDLQFNEEDAEELIGALAGVVSAHVVTDDAGRMVEIHVLATPDLHPKQVVRNVESALSAGLGIEVDRRIVSVAQIRRESNGQATASRAAVRIVEGAGDRSAMHPLAGASASDPEPAPEPAAPRLEYVRYQSRRESGSCSCEVVLRASTGGEEVTGMGQGPDTEAGRAEAAATAVFQAIMRARTQLVLKLEGAVISTSRGRSYVIVSAHTVQGRTSLPLAGAAALTRSPEEAAILASLQATNRWSG